MALQPISLVGEQKRILFLPHTNPIQIKGGAGSGKTTVALYRAKHLVETYSNLFHEPDVMIFTFNNSLMKYIGDLLPFVTGGYTENSEMLIPSSPGLSVGVTTFHKWAYQFLKSKGVWTTFGVASYESQDACILAGINEVKKTHPTSTILKKDIEFYKEEIAWIKGKLFSGEDEYIASPRVGMGNKDRVTKDDKKLLWSVYSGYERALAVSKLLACIIHKVEAEA